MSPDFRGLRQRGDLQHKDCDQKRVEGAVGCESQKNRQHTKASQPLAQGFSGRDSFVPQGISGNEDIFA